VAARLVLEGRAELVYSNRESFRAESARLGAIPDIFEANAPTTVLAYFPVAPFSVNRARTLWIACSLLLFGLAWALLLWALRLPLLVALGLTALVPLFQPWRYDLYLGQAYAPAFFFTVLGGVLAAGFGRMSPRVRHILAGCAFAGLTVVREFYGLVQLFPLLIRKRWAILGSTLAIYGITVLTTFFWFSLDSWGTSLRLGITWRERPETAVTAYQSLGGFLTHLFRYDVTWNQGPVVDLPALVGPLWWLLSLAILAVTAWALWMPGRQPDNPAERLLPYAVGTPVALLLSPISEDYHFMLMLFPIVVVAAMLMDLTRQSRGRQGDSGTRSSGWIWGMWVAFMVGVILLGAPWNYYNVPGTEGWNAFLYYPRLAGNLLVWTLMLVLLRQVSGSRASYTHDPTATKERLASEVVI